MGKRFYILNINLDIKKKRVNQVDYWIGERKIAPIFYGLSTIEQIRTGESHKIPKQGYLDAKLFVDQFSDLNKNNVVLSIGESNIYLFKQKEVMQQYEVRDGNLVKGFEIEDTCLKIPIKDCPLVLVSIKSNRYISAGTFRDLNGDQYFGNRKAIESLINHKPIEVKNFRDYLRCLSSLEFETLVAKLLEEQGLFVPAYKGGFVRNYDLFARNITDNSINFYGFKIEKNERISIQIKLVLQKEHIQKEGVGFFFCIDNSNEFTNANIIDWKEIQGQIKKSPNTRKWLQQTLEWVNFFE